MIFFNFRGKSNIINKNFDIISYLCMYESDKEFLEKNILL